MAALLSTPVRKIEETQVRKIFTTFLQLMYVTFRDMQSAMFPRRAQLRRFLPKVFKTVRKIRCIVDCTEFRVECSRNFARQGNTFSSYKHTNTFKCLIAVTPNGGACFVSDLFEGDADDVQIFRECGIMKYPEPFDSWFYCEGALKSFTSGTQNSILFEGQEESQCCRGTGDT